MFTFENMNTTGKTLIAITAGLAAWFLYQAQQFGANAKARVKFVSFDDIKSSKYFYSQIWLNIGLAISNPSTLAITIRSIALDIYFNGKKIGTVEKLEETPIKPLSENAIVVPAVIPVFSLFATIAEAVRVIKSILKKENTPIRLQIIGLIKTSSGTINIDEKIQIGNY